MSKIKKIGLWETVEGSFSVVWNNLTSFMKMICIQTSATCLAVIAAGLGLICLMLPFTASYDFLQGLFYNPVANIVYYLPPALMYSYLLFVIIAFMGLFHYLYLGKIKMLLAGNKKKKTTLKDFFSVTWDEFVRTSIFILVLILMSIPAGAIVGVPILVIAPVWGKLFLAMALCFLIVRFSLAYYFVLEKESSIENALRSSWKITKGNFLVLLFAPLVFSFLIGLASLVVNLVISAPLAYVMAQTKSIIIMCLFLIMHLLIMTVTTVLQIAATIGCGVYAYKKLT